MSECYKSFYFFNQTVKPTSEFDDTMLAHGKSIYEVIRIVDKVPLFIEKHFVRLKQTAQQENLQLFYNEHQLTEIILKLIEINEVTSESVKIIFSYNNHFFAQNQNIMLVYFMPVTIPTEEQYRNGVKMVSYRTERVNPTSKIINLPQRNFLTEIAVSNEAYETVLIDKHDNITEASRSNFFAIKNQVVITPPVNIVLPGITRGNVIEICKNEAIELIERNIPFSEITEFDAIFITGTSRRLVPVKQIDNQNFTTENELLRELMKKYNNLIHNYIENYQK